MNTKIIFGVAIVIILVAAAYYFGVHEAKAPVSSGGKTQAGATSSTDEHAYQGDNRISAAESALIGKWQSNEDSKFSRVFNADGTIVDSYEGASANQSGTWALSTKESPDSAFPYPYEEGPVYLKVTAGQDILFFKVVSVTPEELDLIYLDRGGALTFKKL